MSHHTYAYETDKHDRDVSGLFCTLCTWYNVWCDGLGDLVVFLSIVESNRAGKFVFDVGPQSTIDIQSAGHAVHLCNWILLGCMVCRNTTLSFFPIEFPNNSYMIRIEICD